MPDGFRLSENIYFAQVGLRIGAAKLADYAKRFGVGGAPACDLPAAKGQLASEGSIDRPTLLADTSYGQGELLVSPLQMALVYATIANGGGMPTPHYGTEVRGAAGRGVRAGAPRPPRPGISPRPARGRGHSPGGAGGGGGGGSPPARGRRPGAG